VLKTWGGHRSPAITNTRQILHQIQHNISDSISPNFHQLKTPFSALESPELLSFVITAKKMYGGLSIE
jgi:hypothetical protein